jgi:hypothetical protein
MRITFLIFVFANIVLLLWQTQIARSDKKAGELPRVPAESQLVLLSEFQAAQTPSLAQAVEESQNPSTTPGLPEIVVQDETASPEPDIAPVAKAAPVCYTLGPFKELDLAKTVTGRLKTLDIATQRRSKVEQEQFGYRVYLPPYPNREAAAAAAQQLSALDIRDYFVISDEEDMKNGISLGLFRKKSGAIRRMAQVRRFDFKPQMEIRYRDTTIYWLDYEQPAELDTEQLLREFAETSPDLQRLDRDCSVAVK